VSEPASEEGRQALQVLRTVWAATGQTDTVFPGDTPGPPGDDLGLECADDERGCSVNVNFDAFADTVEPTTNTAEALDRLRRAWKATLAKEGKLYEPEGEVDPGA
jgi:hypothetical protein